MSRLRLDRAQWAELIQAAEKYRDLAPWKWMYDTPVLGVEDPESGAVGYCSVMGAAGQEFGLAVFRGATGLWALKRFLADESASSSERWLTMRNIDSLNFSLGGRHDVHPAVRRLYRELGYSFRGENDWLVFSSWRPGYYTWPPEGDEVGQLARYLHVTTAFAEWIRNNQAFYDEWDRLSESTAWDQNAVTVLCLVPTEDPEAFLTTPCGAFSLEWRSVVPETPVKIDPAFDQLAAQRARAQARRTDSVWEFDVLALPAGIGEGHGRPVTAEIAIAVDVEAEFVLGFDMTAGEDPSRPASTLLRLIDEAGYLPAAVVTGRADVYDTLQPLLDVLGVKLIHSMETPFLLNVYAGLVESM